MPITTVFQDTFTDTNGTLLRNHVADTGGAWRDPYFDTYAVADPDGVIQISGGVLGAVSESYSLATDSKHYNLSTMPAADYTISADITIGYLPVGFDYLEIQLGARISVSNAILAFFYIFDTFIECYIGVDGSGYSATSFTLTNSTYATTPNTLTTGAHTIKFKVIGDVATAYYDDAIMHTLDLSTTGWTYSSDPGYIGIGIKDDFYAPDPHRMTLNELTVTTDIAESLFWTGRVGCDEVIVA